MSKMPHSQEKIEEMGKIDEKWAWKIRKQSASTQRLKWTDSKEPINDKNLEGGVLSHFWFRHRRWSLKGWTWIELDVGPSTFGKLEGDTLVGLWRNPIALCSFDITWKFLYFLPINEEAKRNMESQKFRFRKFQTLHGYNIQQCE